MALCYGSARFSLAQFLATSNPAVAHSLAPRDGRVAALFAASLEVQGASAADRQRSDRLAHEALARDPTTVFAVSTLGINAQIRGDATAARRLFGYSQRLSRRDLQTQLWAIQDAVGRGDVDDALHHYDITLRVWPAMSDLLFPILATASSEPRVAAALVRTLAARPAWGDGFINYLAGSDGNAEAAAGAIAALRRAGVAVPQYAQAHAVDALIAHDRPDDAWRLYAALHPGVARGRSRDPRFTAALDPPSRLDWVPTSDGDIVTSAQGSFEFSVPTGAGGILLQQVQLLYPGRYVLAGHVGGIEPDGATGLYWTLRCPDGRELGRIALTGPARADGMFAGRFDVPAGCPSQTLALVVRGTDAPAGLAGRIDRVQLSPMR